MTCRRVYLDTESKEERDYANTIHSASLRKASFILFPGVLYRITFPDPYRAFLLRYLMLHKHLSSMLVLKLPNESWVPEFTCHAQVLTTAHHRVRFATFGGGRYRLWRKIILFAARY